MLEYELKRKVIETHMLQVAKNMQEFEAANMKVIAFDLIVGNLMRSMMCFEISD